MPNSLFAVHYWCSPPGNCFRATFVDNILLSMATGIRRVTENLISLLLVVGLHERWDSNVNADPPLLSVQMGGGKGLNTCLSRSMIFKYLANCIKVDFIYNIYA